MLTFLEFQQLDEYEMTKAHREKIAFSHRGREHNPSTKSKIARSMAGKKNHEGKKHTTAAKSRISIKRGEYDPIEGRRWIVNITGKTYRRYKAPEGFKLGKRRYTVK